MAVIYPLVHVIKGTFAAAAAVRIYRRNNTPPPPPLPPEQSNTNILYYISVAFIVTSRYNIAVCQSLGYIGLKMTLGIYYKYILYNIYICIYFVSVIKMST